MHGPINVRVSAPVFLATCLKFCSRGIPTAFFFSKYYSFNYVYYKLVMPYLQVESIFLNF